MHLKNYLLIDMDFKRFLFLLFFTLSLHSFAQYNAKITNLNTSKAYLLVKGQKYFFQLKNDKKVYEEKYLDADKDHVIFESVKATPEQISWISNHYYKNSKVSDIRRNSELNIGVLPKPTFDLEEKFYLEIVEEKK